MTQRPYIFRFSSGPEQYLDHESLGGNAVLAWMAAMGSEDAQPGSERMKAGALAILSQLLSGWHGVRMPALRFCPLKSGEDHKVRYLEPAVLSSPGCDGASHNQFQG